MPQFVNLMPGDPAPWFKQRAPGQERFTFDTAAGRNIVLCFFGSSTRPQAQARLTAALERRSVFNDETASFFGVSADPADEHLLANILPGYRFFWDFDFVVSRLYGAAPTEEGHKAIRGLWVVIDPALHIIATIAFRPGGEDIAEALDLVTSLPPPGKMAGMDIHPPVIVLERVFDRNFCARLIDLYEASGGEPSGFMRDVEGKTRLIHDAQHKSRRDHTLADPRAKATARALVRRRIVPEISKVHQFNVNRMERYLVACYAAEDKAHFRPHRDNTTKGTAHRRFAVTINLNDDFDGGELCFPEYGACTFKPPPGAAVVFSCSMLHAVKEVTRGRRYAFLPFLYDDAAAKVRQDNLNFLEQP